jgi:hypothetical protein
MKIYWFQYFQFFSLLAALVCFNGLRRFSLTVFLPLLVVVCVTELLASNISFLGLTSNYSIYNYYLLVSTPLYLLGFYRMLDLKKNIRLAFLGTSFLCMVFIFFNYFFFEGANKFNSLSLVLIFLLFILFSCLSLSQLAMNDKREVRFFREPYFWISGGLLLFSLGAVVLLGLQGFIAKNSLTINGKNLYRVIMPFLNMVLYCSYSYAFILCRKQEPSLSLSSSQ